MSTVDNTNMEDFFIADMSEFLEDREKENSSGEVPEETEKLHPSIFLELVFSDLRWQNKDSVSYTRESLQFIYANRKALLSGNVSNRPAIIEEAKKIIGARISPSSYYGKMVVNLLAPNQVVSLLVSPEPLVNYALGVGPRVPIFDLRSIDAAISEKGLDVKSHQIVRRTKATLFANAFGPEKLKFQELMELSEYFPQGLYSLFMDMAIQGLKTNARRDALYDYFLGLVNSPGRVDIEGWMKAVIGAFKKSGHTRMQSKRTALLCFFGGLSSAPFTPSKIQVQKQVWVDYGSPTTNMDFGREDYSYVNLMKSLTLVEVLRAIITVDKTYDNRKVFLFDVNLIPNSLDGERLIKKDEAIVSIIVNLLRIGFHVIVYTSVVSAPKIAAQGLYYDAKRIIDYSKMRGFYNATLQQHPGNGALFGARFNAAMYSQMFNHQNVLLNLIFSDDTLTNAMYLNLLGNADSDIRVSVSDVQDIRSVSKEQEYIPTMLDFSEMAWYEDAEYFSQGEEEAYPDDSYEDSSADQVLEEPLAFLGQPQSLGGGFQMDPSFGRKSEVSDFESTRILSGDMDWIDG